MINRKRETQKGWRPVFIGGFYGEIAMVVTYHTIQIHDEMGSSKQLLVEQRLRDTKNTEVYERRVRFSDSLSPDVNWD